MKMIHINAQSEIYTYFGVVPENKAVRKLEQIRDAFMYLNARHKKNVTLVVKTGVHNPELPFRK